MRNKQMVINTCQVLPFSKFRGLMPAKWPLFLDFANSRLPLKKYPFFRENGYERGIRFGREWGGLGLVLNFEVIWRNPALLLPIQNMPFYKQQTRSQPMFLPACTGATCGSTHISRRKTVFTKIIEHFGHFQWLGPNVWWEIWLIWKFFGNTAKECPDVRF